MLPDPRLPAIERLLQRLLIPLLDGPGQWVRFQRALNTTQDA
jgi:hypothetical protein